MIGYDIYFVVDPRRVIITNPYWEKSGAIIHIEETRFPLTWKQLYRQGYRIHKIQVNNK